MELPKTIESCLKLIEKQDVSFSTECKERIQNHFAPEDKDYWFNCSIWLKQALKGIKFKKALESEYQINFFIDIEDVGAINFEVLSKRALDHIVSEKIEKDMSVLITKFSQLKFVDEFGEYDYTKWIHYFHKYYEKRVVPVINDFIEFAAAFCDLDSLLRFDYFEIANEEFVRKIPDYQEDATLSADLGPTDFEKLCASALSEVGWQCHVTKASNDQGVDVIAEKEGFKIAIQCKLYSTNVSNKAVQEIFAGSTFYNCDAAIVVSNAGFTVSARQLAESLNVFLVSFERLVEVSEKIFQVGNV